MLRMLSLDAASVMMHTVMPNMQTGCVRFFLFVALPVPSSSD